MRFLFLVRNQISLNVRVDVSKSIKLSLFFQWNIPLKSDSKKHKWHYEPVNKGIKVCRYQQKFDHSNDRLIKDGILPDKMFIWKVS